MPPDHSPASHFCQQTDLTNLSQNWMLNCQNCPTPRPACAFHQQCICYYAGPLPHQPMANHFPHLKLLSQIQQRLQVLQIASLSISLQVRSGLPTLYLPLTGHAWLDFNFLSKRRPHLCPVMHVWVQWTIRRQKTWSTAGMELQFSGQFITIRAYWRLLGRTSV